MQLNRNNLRKMILAEMKTLSEAGRVNDELYEMESYDLLAFAKQFSSLGDAIQSQLMSAISAGDPSEISDGAMEYIRDRLSGFNRDIDDIIDRHGEEGYGPSDDLDGPRWDRDY